MPGWHHATPKFYRIFRADWTPGTLAGLGIPAQQAEVHSIDQECFWGHHTASSQEVFIGGFGDIDFSYHVLLSLGHLDGCNELQRCVIRDIHSYTPVSTTCISKSTRIEGTYSNANEEAQTALSCASPEVGSQQNPIPAQQKPT
ncbi:hypothetical protein BDZ89DRAFT_1220344 [Hymenopellis radicata]|nr:hypothetical protein BDZ89DRAFT_1220344 [Hymenopellis radicata]